MTFPSDQHVGLVGVTLLGLGLVGTAMVITQENAVIAAIGGVVQIGTGIVGFLGGRAIGRNETLASNATIPVPLSSVTSNVETTITKETISDTKPEIIDDLDKKLQLNLNNSVL